MSAPKLTPWFDGKVKPVRDGVYQRESAVKSPPMHAKFAKGRWYYRCETPKQAARESFVSSDQTRSRWRGLAEGPKQ